MLPQYGKRLLINDIGEPEYIKNNKLNFVKLIGIRLKFLYHLF